MPWPIEGMRILVLGAARTGRAAARFLASRGARAVLGDQAPEDGFPGLRAEMETLGVSVAFGSHSDATFQRADGIVVSPGVPPSLEPLQRARQRGIPVIAEMELAFWFLNAPLVAITGTNGKTTTTTLVGLALERWGRRVFVGGNTGNPLINALALSPPPEFAVVEVSSFQLEGVERFRPRVAALINLTEDHLDRHPTMDIYREAKSRIFRQQGSGDVAIVNLDDDQVLRALPSEPSMEVWGFTLGASPEAQARWAGNRIELKVRGESMSLPLKEAPQGGRQGAQNVMAACLCSLAVQCPPSAFEEAVRGFSGLEHRMEYVGEVRGVSFINDSKATNVGAVLHALSSCPAPLILIAGGKDKGIDFAPLRDLLGQKARAVVLLGEAASRMADALQGASDIHRARTMEEAVARALELARPGDRVLLSPACSSFDMYRDYEERGTAFKAAFRLLAEGS